MYAIFRGYTYQIYLKGTKEGCLGGSGQKPKLHTSVASDLSSTPAGNPSDALDTTRPSYCSVCLREEGYE